MSVRSRRAVSILVLGLASMLWATGGASAPSGSLPPRFRVDWANPEPREFRALPGIGAVTANRLVAALREGTPIEDLPGAVKGLSAEARGALAEQGVPTASAAAPVASQAGPRLDPNAATAEELDLLPGIGQALARKIVEAREDRPFDGLEDLVGRVRGIGPKLRDRLGPLLRFDGPGGELAGSADPR